MKKSIGKNTDPPSANEAPINRKDYAEFLELAVHELDAPLRKMSVMVEKLASKYESGQIDEGRQCLSRAQAGLQHMRSLVDSLYNLSQLDTTERNNVACDTDQLISQVLTELQAGSKEKSLHASQSSLPVVEGDIRQLRQLFKEILQNAIRFSGEKVEIQVEITCKQLSAEEKNKLDLPDDRNYFKLAIGDNGIGFAKEDSQRIFQPFVRLNGRSEYPGNGMGLAICQKIVDNHNGIIYAEPNEHRGSRFLLILPQSLN